MTSKMVGNPGRDADWKRGWHATQMSLSMVERCALLPGDSMAVATTSPNHLSQGESLIFHVCGCSPRLLNGIDRFHKVVIVFVEPIGIPANKNKL